MTKMFLCSDESLKLTRTASICLVLMILLGGVLLGFSPSVFGKVVGALIQGICLGVIAGSRLKIWRRRDATV